MAVATLLPVGRRLLGLWPGGPCPGWDSLYLQVAVPGGTFPVGDAKCCGLLGAPLSPPGAWGPNQPRDEGPLWLKAHGAATGLGQWPCECHLVSAGSPLHRSHHTPPPPRALLPPAPHGCPLCALPVPSPGGPRGAAPVPLSLSQPHCPCPSPAVPVPAAAAPQCRGWLSVPNWLLQPPRPCTGVNWGFGEGGPQRAP